MVTRTTSFLEALIGFLDVQTVMVCLDENGRSSDHAGAGVGAGAGDALSDLWTRHVQWSSLQVLPCSPRGEDAPRLPLFIYSAQPEQRPELEARFGFNSDVYWLVPDRPDLDVPQALRLDSNWFTFKRNGTAEEEIVLHEHYRIKGGDPLRGLVGTWSPYRGLAVKQPETWIRRSDLKGTLLVNSGITWAPFIVIHEGEDRMEGFMPAILDSLRGILNFTVSLTKPADGEWGVQRLDGNGSSYWSGMVGQLARGEVDLCIGGLTMDAERQTAIDFTVGIITDTVSLVIGGYDASDRIVSTTAYLEVFSGGVWCALLLLGLLFALAVAAQDSVLPVPGRGKRRGGFALGQGLALFFRLLIQLTTEEAAAKPFSFRVAFLSCSFLCFFMFQCYIGDLTAVMTAKPLSVLPKSFRDVLDQGRVSEEPLHLKL